MKKFTKFEVEFKTKESQERNLTTTFFFNGYSINQLEMVIENICEHFNEKRENIIGINFC